MIDDVKNAADASSLVIAFGALIEWLPAAAAFLSIVWTMIRLVEWYRTKRRS